MNQILADDFDWISARAECSPSQVFQKLRLQLKNDVEKRNAIRTENEKSRYVFTIHSDTRRISVFVEGQLEYGDTFNEGVVFSRTYTGIDVHKGTSDELLFQATLTLSNDGVCRLRIGDTEHSLWQFRKLALEEVFFTKVAKWRP
jgi:hypothetical protein